VICCSRLSKNAICGNAFGVTLHPWSLRRTAQARRIPQNSRELHLIVLHQPARLAGYQRAGSSQGTYAEAFLFNDGPEWCEDA